jgi:hypothetical protein
MDEARMVPIHNKACTARDIPMTKTFPVIAAGYDLFICSLSTTAAIHGRMIQRDVRFEVSTAVTIKHGSTTEFSQLMHCNI